MGISIDTDPNPTISSSLSITPDPSGMTLIIPASIHLDGPDGWTEVRRDERFAVFVRRSGSAAP